MPKRKKPDPEKQQIDLNAALGEALDIHDNFKVAQLLEAKADPNAISGEDGRTLFQKYVCDRPRPRILNKLLRAGAKVDTTAPHTWHTPLQTELTAEFTWGNSFCKTLLRHKADPNFPSGRFERTPLQQLLFYMNYEKRNKLMDYLLLRNAHVDQTDAFGRTALHISSLHPSIDCLRKLLPLSSNINAKTFKDSREHAIKDPATKQIVGETPLHFYCGDSKQQKAVIETLHLFLEKGADFFEPNSEGDTPYSLSKKKPHYLTVYNGFQKRAALQVKSALDTLLLNDLVNMVIDYVVPEVQEMSMAVKKA